MKLTSALTLLASATTALADGASIVAAMTTISNATTNLQSAVASWDGSLLGTLPILADSTVLLHDINSGTKTAKESAALSDLEAIGVAQATLNLASVVNSTLTTIIAARPKFDDLLLGPVILLNLDLEKDATDRFSSAVIAKVPTALQSTAESLVAPIDDSFDEAIEAYKLF